MSTLRVALLQMAPHGTDQDANRAKGEAFCRQAREMGADIALFPEMWNIGYTGYCSEVATPETDLWRAPKLWQPGETSAYEAHRAEREVWQARAIGRDGAFIQHFQALARELEMAVAITYLEQWPTAPRNSVSLIDRHGEIVLTYAKVHTCDFDLKEAALTPGDGFFVAALDTAAGPVQVGAMICYDREFPESARVLMLQGAELILVPNACEMERHRTAQLATRAVENMVAVALANYAAPKDNGHSMAFDPIAFDAHGSRDTLVIEAGEAEGVYLAPFDLDAIREYRRREAWGNAFRHPTRYGAITSLDVRPPFMRVNERGEPYPRER
ncbi:MAG TPA: carbon-nitrogen hydrolase family protein [Ktedonobacterales bacterium]|nr:carbon-nitrogen hydrolase family protein [Ktedonobacterales bacterium]